MAFVAIGVLLGPLVADELTAAPTSATVRTLAEATLAVVLFLDASRIQLRALRREYSVPLRLLGIGLPLTIALGAVAGAVMFGQLTFSEALVLAVVLAPTDAALGQAVVTEPRLPSRIRQGLNVESGLNDGICVPLLLVVLAAADVESNTTTSHHAVKILAEEIGYGLVGGIAAGTFAAALLGLANRRNLIEGSWLQVIPVAAAALAYGIAAALGGSGFIAAFVAGGLFAVLVGRESEEASRFGEEVGGVLGGVTFLMFGATLLGPALEHLTWQVILYAVLSLTAIRMLPVAVAMLGSGARSRTVGFLGWFGPRGLASIVFAVIGLSVMAHGLTAAPLASRYADWYESHPSGRRPMMESVPAASHRARGPKSVMSGADPGRREAARVIP
jgi:NhaP-type Na+/H+ or K+/H+ antiporter